MLRASHYDSVSAPMGACEKGVALMDSDANAASDPSRHSRRDFLQRTLGGAAVVVGGLLAACGSGSSSGTTSSSTTTTTSAANKPKRGGSLRLASSGGGTSDLDGDDLRPWTSHAP